MWGRTMTDKTVYNEELINALEKIRRRSGVSYDIMAYLLDLPPNTAYAYLTKRRNMVKSEDERSGLAAIRILSRLVKETHLPIPRKPGRPRKGEEGKYNAKVISLIDDCAARILAEDKAAKKQAETNK